MDRTQDCGSCDVGSIPTGSTEESFKADALEAVGSPTHKVASGRIGRKIADLAIEVRFLAGAPTL